MGRGENLVKLPALEEKREGGRGRGRKEISSKDRAEGVRDKEEMRRKEKRRKEGWRKL